MSEYCKNCKATMDKCEDKLAARDTEWAEGGDKVFSEYKPYYCFNPNYPDCEPCAYKFKNACVYFKWRQLKQSMGVKG